MKIVFRNPDTGVVITHMPDGRLLYTNSKTGEARVSRGSWLEPPNTQNVLSVPLSHWEDLPPDAAL
jgi:hypothetical protein